MSRLSLSLACGAYELLAPLIEGAVRPKGIELNVQTYSSPERHWRMARHLEFDCCEFSLGSYLAWYREDCPVIAIPVFPHRRFRHSYMFCRDDGSITQPSELNGRCVGLRTYQNTAGIWSRGILQDDYGVDLNSITWLAQDDEDIPLRLPEGVRLERVAAGQRLDRLLTDGTVDAVLYPNSLPAIDAGEPGVQRLIPNHREVEVAYYKRTGIFPLMHTVVIKKRLLDSHPWIAVNLLSAFRQAKAMCYERAGDPRRYPFAWIVELREEQRALLGDDPWPFALEPNRVAIETFARYATEQGILSSQPKIEELFFPPSLDEPPGFLT